MNSDTQNELIDIRGLLSEYARFWWLFIVCVIVCVALGVAYIKIHQPEFAVHSNILIAQDDSKGSSQASLRNAFGDVGSLFGAKGNVDDEVYIVSSHSVLVEAAKELGLDKRHAVRGLPTQWYFRYKNYPIDVIAPDGLTDTLSTFLRFRVAVGKKGNAKIKVYDKIGKLLTKKVDALPATVETPYGEFTVVPTPSLKKGESITAQVLVNSYDAAAEQIAQDVSINIAGKKTNAVTLNTKSVDKQFAKDLLNTIVDKYNVRSIADRNVKNEKTATFIDGRLELLMGDLSNSESSIEAFKKSEGITDLVADATYEFTRKGAFETELVEAQAQQMILEDMKAFASKPENRYEMMPITESTAAVKDVVTNYNTLLLQRMKLLGSGGNSGGVNLRKLDEQIDAQHANLIQSLQKAQESAALSVKQIRAKMGEADARLGRMPTQQRVYLTLMRDQRIKEELYLFLLQRREETAMTLANNTPKAVIIDRAYSDSKPLGLTGKKVLVLAAIMGFLMAPVILYMRRLLRNKFENPTELQKLTKVPMLGEVCTSRSGNYLVVKPTGSTSTAELFRLIRTNLQFVLSGRDDQVILITSTRSGEGKSFIAVNLAASLSLTKKRVILVGLDIRAPQLANYLGIEGHKGVTDYLSTPDLTLDDIIVHDPTGNGMDVIVAGPIPPNPSELLLSDRLDNLFKDLRRRYNYVVVDSAPVGMVSDTFSLVRVSDATVYVCRAKYTSMTDVRFFNELYSDRKLPKMSLVVNGTQSKKGYGYGYGATDNG